MQAEVTPEVNERNSLAEKKMHNLRKKQTTDFSVQVGNRFLMDIAGC
jgi:hypothetical protein